MADFYKKVVKNQLSWRQYKINTNETCIWNEI